MTRTMTLAWAGVRLGGCGVTHLVVQPEDVVIDADFIELDKGLDVTKHAEHGVAAVCQPHSLVSSDHFWNLT